MDKLQKEQSIIILLEKELVERIMDFKIYNRQTYIDFSKESDMHIGIEEKLYGVLRYANVFIESAKRELEGYFTRDEALLLFVCLVDEDIHQDFEKPGQELMRLIYDKRERVEEFFMGKIPMQIIREISRKSQSLTSSQFLGLKAMTIELRNKSKTELLKISDTDISECFRSSSGSPRNEKVYEIKIN